MFAKFHLFSKKEKQPRAEVARSILERAYRDWRILLLSAIALGVVVVALDAYLLWRVNSGDIFMTETTAETDTTITDKKTLSNVVKFFDDRTASFETFKTTPRTEIDPSL